MEVFFMDINTEPIVAGNSFSAIKDNINNNFSEIKEGFKNIDNKIASNVIFGVYVGNGEESKDITGFKDTPIAVEVWARDGRPNTGNSGWTSVYNGIALKDYPCKNDKFTCIEIIPNGFRVYYKYSSTGASAYTNFNNCTYYYKAYMAGTIKD